MKRINNDLLVIAFNIYLSETKQQANSNSFDKFQALPFLIRLYYHDKAYQMIITNKNDNY